jgi:hypothetical protein
MPCAYILFTADFSPTLSPSSDPERVTMLPDTFSCPSAIHDGKTPHKWGCIHPAGTWFTLWRVSFPSLALVRFKSDAICFQRPLQTFLSCSHHDTPDVIMKCVTRVLTLVRNNCIAVVAVMGGLLVLHQLEELSKRYPTLESIK